MDTKINYAKMFVAYSQGHPLNEIAFEYACNETELKSYAVRNHWDDLVIELAKPGDIVAQDKSAMELLKSNRQKNMEMTNQLIKGVENYITAFEKGTWKPKHMNEMKTLFEAVRTLMDMTYKAAGDTGSSGTWSADGPKPALQFNLNMPLALLKPRGTPQDPGNQEPIDVKP